MTHREIRVLEDGTRVYADGRRYTPLAADQRTYAVRKPADPRAIRWGGQWLLPLDLAPDESRVMPETRPDDIAFEHAQRTMNCRCEVCVRPEAERWRRAWLRRL